MRLLKTICVQLKREEELENFISREKRVKLTFQLAACINYHLACLSKNKINGKTLPNVNILSGE